LTIAPVESCRSRLTAPVERRLYCAGEVVPSPPLHPMMDAYPQQARANVEILPTVFAIRFVS
jgi:hypothetical protein